MPRSGREAGESDAGRSVPWLTSRWSARRAARRAEPTNATRESPTSGAETASRAVPGTGGTQGPPEAADSRWRCPGARRRADTGPVTPIIGTIQPPSDCRAIEGRLTRTLRVCGNKRRDGTCPTTSPVHVHLDPDQVETTRRLAESRYGREIRSHSSCAAVREDWRCWERPKRWRRAVARP